MKPSIDSFPNAPHGWSIEAAIEMATTDGIALSDDHWQLISALQEYYAKVEHPNLRQLKDALEGNPEFRWRLVKAVVFTQAFRLKLARALA